MRLLVIEDDLMIGESLQRALRADGYAVDWIQDGQEAFESIPGLSCDMILLDLGLPGQSGMAILKALRDRHSEIPVLIMTARDTVKERVGGLDAGADDYLVKPFSLDELEARIRAVLRRKGGRSEPVITCGQLALNPTTKALACGDVSEQLSAREYAIMHALMERPGAVLSRAQLEEKLYGWNEEVSSNSVEVHIHSLRKKFGKDIIRNIRGMGYMAAQA